MPRRRKDALTTSCAECGASFQTVRDNARFCSAPHKLAFANRMAARGKVVMPFLLAWIAGKGGGNTPTHPVAGPSMKELTSITRGFLDEDKAAGRPPATDYAESLFASGFLYMDRKPKRPARSASR